MNLKARLARAERAIPSLLPSQVEEEAYARYLKTLSLEELRALQAEQEQKWEASLTPEQRRDWEAQQARWRQMTPTELIAEWKRHIGQSR